MLCSYCLGLAGDVLEQLNVASLSRPTVFLQCYSLLLLGLYFGQINDDDDDDMMMCDARVENSSPGHALTGHL